MEVTAAELAPAQIRFLESSIRGFSTDGWGIELAGQAASARRFFRISRGGESYILVEWDSRDEDWPRFLGIEAYVSPTVDFLPRIYANDPVHGLILEEDLGALTLKRFCVDNAGGVGAVEQKYREVIGALYQWQRLDVSGCPVITSRAMDLEVFLWESSYFAQHCVTGHFGREELLTDAWEEERLRMAESADAIPRVCIHRDFQSENILTGGLRIRFVDYQGARMGPPHYDAASLLFDPYVDLGYGLIERLADYYFDVAGGISDRANFYICAAQRLMQALGAYGNLSLHKGKPHYRQFIRPAAERLSYVLKFLPDYPVMGEIVDLCLTPAAK
jgi:hypothetical protein